MNIKLIIKIVLIVWEITQIRGKNEKKGERQKEPP